ncbi:hypothetical protein [Methanosalsum natronophilum]|uniref:Uncharacterized protein n=1 Tax=Methanosalsum natronophilum TaxID=768733 RepID=A0A3R7VYS1_9EURY|nr:hypothetical protein [Methanosalsum natronophilum]MCS3924422.1 hypothetical protein [Methanosalsum natronophilum]RQD88791.1 MAG: hypothetical protein D5R95_02730 [Methanosalsum natronophilum]
MTRKGSDPPRVWVQKVKQHVRCNIFSFSDIPIELRQRGTVQMAHYRGYIKKIGRCRNGLVWEIRI